MTVHIQDEFPECKPFGYFAKRAIVELIRSQEDAKERVAWIDIALAQGVITQADAEFLA